MLAAVAIPNFIRFQARARQSEVNSNLKTLFTGLRTFEMKPQSGIRVPGFAPERGNRFTYYMNDPCSASEDRSAVNITQHPTDDCIEVDRFKFTGMPALFPRVPPTAANWNTKATANGMGLDPGMFGDGANWDFMSFAAGDVDNSFGDAADTWLVSSSDGLVTPACPVTAQPERVSAGEPFNVSNDVSCD
ncbi:pilin [Hyalangium rubrum]|uniref:pilin n=1 Tax=Hyalangium rubrum TaxID=3103134 RepID=UPI003BF4F469